MILTSLDSIIRKLLLKKELTLHYYISALVSGVDCLRDLTLDSLQVVNNKLVPINSFGEAEIPAGMADVVSLNVLVGQQLRPLVEDNSLNSLATFDSNFNQTTYSEINNDTADNPPINYGWGWFGAFMTSHFSNYGEPIGRFFGYSGSNSDTYKVVKERNVFQLNEALIDVVDEVQVIFIGDGRSADAATSIEPYAEAAIEAYIDWQFANKCTPQTAEHFEYSRQVGILRARKSNLNTIKLGRIINRNTKNTIKN